MDEVEKIKKVINEEEVNPDKEAQYFFNSIKARVTEFDLVSLEESLKEIPNQIHRAERSGQIFLANKLKKHIYLMMKEKVLLQYGINKFLSLYEITKFIDKVEDFVVKFCELEAFPRIIPEEVLSKLEAVKELGIFENFYIAFTDYTDEEIISERAKKQRDVNKDPIIFGVIKGYPDRYYFIVDWVDDYCDLTFDKLISELKKIDPKYKQKEILGDTEKYINELLPQIKEQIEEEEKKEKERENMLPFKLSKKPWWKRIFN